MTPAPSLGWWACASVLATLRMIGHNAVVMLEAQISALLRVLCYSDEAYGHRSRTTEQTIQAHLDHGPTTCRIFPPQSLKRVHRSLSSQCLSGFSPQSIPKPRQTCSKLKDPLTKTAPRASQSCQNQAPLLVLVLRHCLCETFSCLTCPLFSSRPLFSEQHCIPAFLHWSSCQRLGIRCQCPYLILLLGNCLRYG